MHTRIKNEGVEVLANWITESDTTINGKTVPAGSWMTTFAVTNEELLSSIKDGSIGGISLGSVSEEAMTKKQWFINKSIHYQDLNDMEEVIPLFISFVDKGANQYGLEIEEYNVYINKNNKNGEKMTKENSNEEAMIPISALGKLRDIFSINKNEDDESNKEDENEINKEETVETPSTTGDISNKELLEQLPSAVATAVKEAIGEAVATTPTDPVIDKSDEEDENKDDNDINKSDESNEDNNDKDDNKPDETNDSSDNKPESNDDLEINKRQSSMGDVIVDDAPSSDFYKRTGRDHLGRKIRH